MQTLHKAVVFVTGGEEYAFPVEAVISIEKMENINPIPHFPRYFKGITKSRGELLPVVDLEYLFYHRQLSNIEEARLIIVQSDSFPIGFLVKEAKEIMDVPEESIRQMGLLASGQAKYFCGVADLENRLVTMIDTNALVSSLEGVQDIKEYLAQAEAR
ncbi:chemotaxis protein CheW [Bacillus xiapuensis]|uniref:chemotaxis protein CheW n=1 Tax=Bacillus xiapuensis TaxID=2014075 RepID=UPI000C240FBB|nr:chemotaxis protein CheW [Bacillus xiapuensis]